MAIKRDLKASQGAHRTESVFIWVRCAYVSRRLASVNLMAPGSIPGYKITLRNNGFSIYLGNIKRQGDLLINQTTIKVKKSMFRKHGSSKFNQHIRVIQSLVPRRQCVSHNPIHPSRGISPLQALTSQDGLGHLPTAVSFSGSGSVLIVHWPGFTTAARLSLCAAPTSSLFYFSCHIYFLFWGYMDCPHTLP